MIETFTALLQRVMYGPVDQVVILSPESMMETAIDFRREILREQYDEDVGIKIVQVSAPSIKREWADELLEACGDNGFIVSELTTRGGENSFRIEVEAD